MGYNSDLRIWEGPFIYWSFKNFAPKPQKEEIEFFQKKTTFLAFLEMLVKDLKKKDSTIGSSCVWKTAQDS
jgi:hypothetical protein